jgi:hypothetical protein
MLDLALNVGTELTIVLASNGDVSVDVTKVIGVVFVILTFVCVFSMMVGEATGPYSGAAYLLEMETSLGREVLPTDG